MTAGAKTLVVTNDFPPSRGGIESFVLSLCDSLPSDRLVVYTSRMRGAEQVDRTLAYPVVRDRSPVLLPTRSVARSVQRVAAREGCDRVLFGAAAPLGLLARGLRTVGVRRIVALTHGHEVWWSTVPGARALLRRIAGDVDVLTYVSEFCRAAIAAALPPEGAGAMRRLSPGVDTEVFRPDVDGALLRRRLGIAESQQVVLAASRLVLRKGHDVLLAGWPRVLAAHPDAVLLVVGDGPARARLERSAARPAVAGSIRFLRDTPLADMPLVYAAADVFAIPCRTRLGGLEPEALGIVFLEAAATGLPVVVGASGGAPETVIDGETGFVVDPRSCDEVATAICRLLADPERGVAMGRRGRAFVRQAYSAADAGRRLRHLLEIESQNDERGAAPAQR